MAAREGVDQVIPDKDGTRTIIHDLRPGAEGEAEDIKQLVSEIMAKSPTAIVIFAEYDGKDIKDFEGTTHRTAHVIAGAVGSPITLNELVNAGIHQLRDMMKKAQNSGENG
jgi:ATP-dependent protease ClpP protease subunit